MVHLARCETQDLYNTDTSDMNESQSWSLPSLNFLSANLTWLHMYIWLSLLNPCLHSGEVRYNLKNWCFWLLNIVTCLIKQTQMIANVLMWTEFKDFPKNSKKTFQNNSWLVDGHAIWIWSWIQLKHPWQAAKKWQPPGYATRNKSLALKIHKATIVLSLFFANCVNATAGNSPSFKII